MGVTQKHIDGKYVAGRDIKNFNFGNSIPGSSYMDTLIQRLKGEMENNDICKETLENLTHLSTRIRQEKLIGLRKKLEAGNRLEYLDYAQDVKEAFFRKIKKTENYASAQEIYALLLSEVYSRFMDHVYSSIIESKSNDEVNLLIAKFVIEPIQSMLGENILKIFRIDIEGMLYFLTDNCHIKWSKDVNL